MRREVLAVAILMLVTMWPAQAAPGPSTQEFLPHAPISILSDYNFTADNGVISGTGTPADPYVIAGWHIRSKVGSAIYVYNTTLHFVIRDNILEGPTGMTISAVDNKPLIANNKFLVTGQGLLVKNADPTILDNSFIGTRAWFHTGTAMTVTDSNALIQGNTVSLTTYGIMTERGSPTVVWNEVHHVGERGIRVLFAVGARIEHNTVTHVDTLGVELVESQHSSASFNNISTVGRGLQLWLGADLDVRNNTVRYSMLWGVLFEASTGNFTGNVVIDGMADGVLIWASTLVMVNNTVMNHLGIGFHFSMSESLAEGNLFVSNGIGIAVRGASIPHLRANVLVNNTIGLDIPYDSRQTIFWMHGNIVNGINVDGRVDASQQTLFYRAANASLTGLVDGGFSAGYYGSLTAQGQVVVYDTDTAMFDGLTIAHGQVGLGIVNSFNVQLQNSAVLGAIVGVKAQALDGKTTVPPCVVSIKDTNITYPIDPPLTVGIQLDDCLAFIVNASVSLVDVGIKLNANARASIANSTIVQNKVGLDIAGAKDEVEVRGSIIAHNRVGARFAGTHGVVEGNTFLNNSVVGVRLEAGAHLQFRANNLTGNGAGMIDTRACGGARTCSSIDAEGNSFWRNRGDGARIHGKTTWRDDVFLENRGSGLRLSTDTSIRNVVASRNDDDGLAATGGFIIRNSEFDHNGGNGAYLRGTGQLRDSTFRHNEYAGIRLYAIYVQALQLNVSFNFDGIIFDELAPTPSTGPLPSIGLPEIFQQLPNGQPYGPDPLDVHLTTFVGNTRDAIRAGAAVVNATYNYWGTLTGPSMSFGDEIGAYRNGVSPYVRYMPYYQDPEMTTTGPIFLL